MNRNVTLRAASVLAILFFIIHVVDDIMRGYAHMVGRGLGVPASPDRLVRLG